MGRARRGNGDDARPDERKPVDEGIPEVRRYEEIDLDPEDEAALDAIWDEIGHEDAEAGDPPPGYVPRPEKP